MMEIREAKNKQEYGYCAAIRAIVFLEEQNCEGGIKVEYDAYEDVCKHFVLYENGEPVGTARYRILDGSVGKIERIAVLKEHRGKGVGKNLVEHLTNQVKSLSDVKKIIMSAQDYALPFYEKLGYSVVGEGYIETGIPHHKIEMDVS